MKTNYRDIVFHPLVLGAMGLVVLIAAGSAAYYAAATKAPAVSASATTATTSAQVLTATGIVEPAQNPDLAFVSGGKVTRVNVKVGQSVTAGQVLASLDTASLSAQRASAAANLASQQSKLSEMQQGARQVDIQAKQTAVDQANNTLQNTYANVASTIQSARDKALSGITANTDPLFSQPNTPSPVLSFNTTNTQTGIDAQNARAQANNTIQTWSAELTTISSGSSQSELDNALSLGVTNLNILRNFTDKTLAALASGNPNGTFSQAQLSAAQTSVGALRDTINGQILALQALEQQISTQKLAVRSAQDALNQVLAGSTPQDIASQQAQVDAASANVAMYNAQISNAVIVAPFSGTVASVRVKPGDIVAPNTAAISLNPKAAQQVVAYFSAIDITKLKAGMPVSITLDAYGSSKVFSATLVSVDTAPSPVSNTPNAPTGYKATFQFDESDPSITSGMGANISITIK